jgi:UDP-N-acetylmuramoylalanine--D-glutamate ligase
VFEGVSMQVERPLRGSRVALIGLGIEGRDLGRFLVHEGARVTAFDTRTRAAVAEAAAELEALGVEVRLGPIPADEAERFDALYASQSVLLHREPFALNMRALGRPVGSMLHEFLRRWPGPVLGVSGSSGKTTTTALVAAAFAAGCRPHIVGGNIGAGLLAQLPSGDSHTWAVLEISHTQLQLLERGPDVAVLTNVTPNHLDQFDWDGYIDLKRTLIRHQAPDAVAVLNATNPTGAALAADTAARIVWFNADVTGQESFFVEGDALMRRIPSGTTAAFLELREIPLRGAHNVENVLAAAAAVCAAGIDLATVAAAVRRFQAVAHRLEPAGTVGGVSYVNDSIATSPERTLAGIRSFTEPLVLLLGGREKRLPLAELAAAAHARARAIVCFGEAGAMLAEAMERGAPANGTQAVVVRVYSLAEAVEAAQAAARPGDVVLLSPACTSFDAYPNFERRGEEFRRLVTGLAAREQPFQPRTTKEGAPSPR